MFIVDGAVAVAGTGAAALFSGGMSIIGYTVPLQKRPIFRRRLSRRGVLFLYQPCAATFNDDRERVHQADRHSWSPVLDLCHRISTPRTIV
jgi:hypothetical protein